MNTIGSSLQSIRTIDFETHKTRYLSTHTFHIIFLCETHIYLELLVRRTEKFVFQEWRVVRATMTASTDHAMIMTHSVSSDLGGKDLEMARISSISGILDRSTPQAIGIYLTLRLLHSNPDEGPIQFV